MSYTNTHHQEIFQSYNYPTQNNYYISDGNSPIGTGDESNFWSSSPRSDSPSPSTPYQSYPFYTATDQRSPEYRSTYQSNSNFDNGQHIPTPYVRVVKRRTTANKKERRRTQSINNAYADLRDCIPNVPPDTKLSKIKTLRLATSYINYLVKALETDDTAGGFTAELGTISSRKSTNNSVLQQQQQQQQQQPHQHQQQLNECTNEQINPPKNITEDMNKSRKAKGRTGWPQHVWALELEQDQQL